MFGSINFGKSLLPFFHCQRTLKALRSDALNNMNDGTDSYKLLNGTYLVPVCALVLKNNLCMHAL